MTLIYLVRHGKAAASFTDDLDPGLDNLGRQQAQTACASLANLSPLQLLSSPLLRAQETAAPLAENLNSSVSIENRVAEIPSPNLSLQERGAWLGAVMEGQWSTQSESLQAWRNQIETCLLSISANTVIFTHFVAINAAVSLAEKSDKVLIFRPDNCSITIIETDGKTLQLVERGQEAVTKVN
ncbi:MAG: histidine phosphatase family protein [Pseudomonadales bacterium]|nr:histidine phosphatase family protein [Pseudomonadales bacterium]